MKLRRPIIFAFVLFALALGAATAAAAPQGSWQLPAVDLSAPGQDAHFPQVAVAPDGTATAVWYRYDGSNYIVQATTRPAGGDFGTPEDLSATGQNADQPQVAVAPDGATTVVWRRFDGSNYIVQATTRPAGGSFGTPVDLSATGRDAEEPQVAVAADGATTVVWRRFDGSNYIVQATTRPAGGDFGTPEDLSATGRDAEEPQVAVAPDGATTVVWYIHDGSNWIVQAATRPAGGDFGEPVNLTTSDQISREPQVAVAPDGTTTVVWWRFDGSGYIVQAATRPADGNFGTPLELSDGFVPQVLVTPDGTTTVVWQRFDGDRWIIQASTRPAGGDFGTPVNLSQPGGGAYYPQVAVNPEGTTTAVWHRNDGMNFRIQAATRPAGGDFGSPVNLSAPDRSATDAQVAVAPDGVAIAVWHRYDGSNEIVQAAWTQKPLRLKVTRVGKGSGKVTSSPAGIDCGSQCSESFLPGTVVTLTATPKSGSTFTGWSGACTGSAPICKVTMNVARSVSATFTRVPVNPPNDSTAIYDPATGRLKIRLKCGPRYRPKCLTMVARAVTGKGRKAKVMSKAATVKNVKAGKWKLTTLKIKPKFRAEVRKMGQKSAKTLWARITVTWKKKGKKQVRTVHHRYRVMVRQ